MSNKQVHACTADDYHATSPYRQCFTTKVGTAVTTT